jgi:hypothetical protein
MLGAPDTTVVGCPTNTAALWLLLLDTADFHNVIPAGVGGRALPTGLTPNTMSMSVSLVEPPPPKLITRSVVF